MPEEVEEGGWYEETEIKSEIARSKSYIIEKLISERSQILENEKLEYKQKLKFLKENRNTITLATGGRVTQTENVAYGILLFGGLIVVVLSMLTAFAGLPSEVTLSFVGTVLGGTIATISQKLGKI